MRTPVVSMRQKGKGQPNRKSKAEVCNARLDMELDNICLKVDSMFIIILCRWRAVPDRVPKVTSANVKLLRSRWNVQLHEHIGLQIIFRPFGKVCRVGAARLDHR